jgi:2-keto-3-deoxy-L-rhamnonate aldolase RhmA
MSFFPFTSTPDLACKAAQASRYQPTERRGSGARLVTITWSDSQITTIRRTTTSAPTISFSPV